MLEQANQKLFGIVTIQDVCIFQISITDPGRLADEIRYADPMAPANFGDAIFFAWGESGFKYFAAILVWIEQWAANTVIDGDVPADIDGSNVEEGSLLHHAASPELKTAARIFSGEPSIHKAMSVPVALASFFAVFQDGRRRPARMLLMVAWWMPVTSIKSFCRFIRA